jgi:type IX secretion system PorP/SprF family membrane protein
LINIYINNNLHLHIQINCQENFTSMKKKLIYLLFLSAIWLSLCKSALAQDPLFSQYFTNPLYLNPAYAGSLGCSRIAANYRNQWPSIPGTFRTFSTSYDQYINNVGGIGFQFMTDNQGKGIIITNTISSMYAYDLIINDKLHIRPAVNIGIGVEKLDWSKLTFGDQIDPGYAFIQNPISPPMHNVIYYFNAGLGLLVAYKNLISGISYDHINRPDIGILSPSRLPTKLTIHSSYQFNFANNTSLTPGIIYQQQQDFKYVMPSVMLKIWYIKAGTACRVSLGSASLVNTVITMIGFVNKWMSIAYSYDYVTSVLTENTGGSHEFSAIFKFNCKNKEKHRVTSLYGF